MLIGRETVQNSCAHCTRILAAEAAKSSERASEGRLPRRYPESERDLTARSREDAPRRRGAGRRRCAQACCVLTCVSTYRCVLVLHILATPGGRKADPRSVKHHTWRVLQFRTLANEEVSDADGDGSVAAAGGTAAGTGEGDAEELPAEGIDLTELLPECRKALDSHECTANFTGNAKNIKAHAYALLADRFLQGDVRNPDTGEKLPRAVIFELHMVQIAGDKQNTINHILILKS